MNSQIYNLLILLNILIFSSSALAAKLDLSDCGSLRTHFGPYDYRTDKIKLPIVEDSHFTDVTYRMAISGNTNNEEYFKAFEFGPTGTRTGKSAPLPADINYTLNAFPNHPRALFAMSEYQRQVGEPPSTLSSYEQLGYRSISCYFVRAEKFAPNDPIVYMINAINHHKRKQYSAALELYKKAEQLDGDNVELLYNIGLLFADMGKISSAKQYAERVYKIGYPLLGLKHKIDKAIKK